MRACVRACVRVCVCVCVCAYVYVLLMSPPRCHRYDLQMIPRTSDLLPRIPKRRDGYSMVTAYMYMYNVCTCTYSMYCANFQLFLFSPLDDTV